MSIPKTDDKNYDIIKRQVVLPKVFSYLKVHELLRAARVCRSWKESAESLSLWKRVSLKNSLVRDWQGLAATLQARCTEDLDLRKMLIDPSAESIWDKFLATVPSVTSLRKLELCRCPAVVVEDIIARCPKLRFLRATFIQCESICLESISNLTELCELKLKGVASMVLGDITELLKLSGLTHLSLTSFKNLTQDHVDVIKCLDRLISLELGECSGFSNAFGTKILTRLQNLEHLRLEKGQDKCNIFDILEGASRLKKLSRLELVNFDVKPGFEKHLANCANIKMLLIIPTYVSQSATTSHLILKGVGELSNNLTHFVWGVTQELIKVTELFRNDCRKARGDSIPVLKPVPYSMNMVDVIDGHGPNDIEVVSLSQIQEFLWNALPETRVKILKIPFHATWRQGLAQVVY